MTPILLILLLAGSLLLMREWRRLQARNQRVLDVAHEGHEEPRGLLVSPTITPVELVVPKTPEPERLFPRAASTSHQREPRRSIFDEPVFTPVVDVPTFHFRDEPVYTYPVEEHRHHRDCYEPSPLDQDSHHRHHHGDGSGWFDDEQC